MDKLDYDRLKREIKDKFNFEVSEIKYLGGGVDSNAYLVNNEYVFKFGISKNSKEDYRAQKVFSDFYKNKKFSNIETPNIEYYYCCDELQIVGYKMVEGTFIDRLSFYKMDVEQQEKIIKDMAIFLKNLHKYNQNDIDLQVLDMKDKMLKEVELIKNTIYDSLTDNEKKYIDRFEERIKKSNVFDGKKCICHIDFNPDHILIDKNNNFKGVIDWGGAAIACEYAEFPYLLSNGDDEMGRDFGLKVLDYYKDIDIDKAIEYSNIHRMEYPLTELVYGIENKNQESISFGKKIILKKCNFDDDIKRIMK